MERFRITSHASAETCEACSLGPNWWVFAVRGALAVVFGCLAVFRPVATIVAITVVFGAYACIDGIFHLVAGLNQARRGERWGGLVLVGVLGITAGLLMLVAPHVASLGLTLLLWSTLAAWAIASGAALIAVAVRLRREIPEEWLMTSNGVVLVLLGAAVLFLLFGSDPATSMYTLAFVVSLASLCCGAVNLLLAYKLFRQDREPPVQAAP
jgi:uncharacterized membrane protein HdeD (DUF308 family)